MLYLIVTIIGCTWFLGTEIHDLVAVLEKIYDHIRWGAR